MLKTHTNPRHIGFQCTRRFPVGDSPRLLRIRTIFEAGNSSIIVSGNLHQFGTSPLHFGLGRLLVRKARECGDNTHDQKVQEVKVKAEPNHSPRAEEGQTPCCPPGKHLSPIVPFSHLEPTGNQNCAECQEPHAHEYPENPSPAANRPPAHSTPLTIIKMLFISSSSFRIHTFTLGELYNADPI